MRSFFLLLVAALGCACAGPKWDENTTIDPDAVFLREILVDVVPDVPAPSHLRPCCAFGSGIRVRLGPIPVPGVLLENIIGPEDVGVHRYDNGLMSLRKGEDGLEIVKESNGLVYTCRGGFLDTAHVRDYSDWTVYLASQIARAVDTGTTLTLKNEGAVRKIHIQPLPADLLELSELRATVIALSQYLAFQLSIWHEISTWLGWSASAAFSEEASAFSPEDLYSNLVGIKIAGRVMKDLNASSEEEFNEHLSEILIKAVELLGGVPAAAGQGAARHVDGVWWQSEKRLPSADLVLKRNMDIGEVITPWRISESHWAQGIEDGVDKYCGGDDRPVVLSNPSSYEGIAFSEMATLELTLEEKTAERLPIPIPEGRVLTQSDFPRLIAAIRIKNDERYGAGASTPTRMQSEPAP
ncbi:MAG: DUF4056 domain-containing protein [Deltaproteobacteria bacterium]|nr:DUF4056 domain-containing protein [Deltaproteobacteria bacterium]